MFRYSLITLCLTIGLAMSHSSATAADQPPNILIAIADDWGYGHASAYQSKWVNTPAFDDIARQGLLFTRAYTPNAKCAPSRACLLTGRNSWQLKEAANHLCYFPSEFKTWCELLSERGWHVGHTLKGWGPGVALNAQGKPRLMTGKPYNKEQLQPPTSEISKIDYAANFNAFLKDAQPDQPWCFWYGSIEPHRQYEFGSSLKQTNKKLSDIDHVPAHWPDNETIRTDMLDYALEIEYFDSHLGRMLQTLKQQGQLERTIVIVTSDHGMPFPRCKGGAYEASNHIPLAVMWGDGIQKPGRVIDDYVSLIDVAPTLLEAVGMPWAQTGMAPATGRSLIPIFRSNQSGRIDPLRDHVLIGMERHDIGRPLDVGYPIRGIIANDQLYLHNFESDRWPACNPETGYLNVDGGATKTWILNAQRESGNSPYWQWCFGKRPTEELYDLKRDPDCVVNLALSDQGASEANKLKERLFKQLLEQNDPRMLGNGKQFDEYIHSNPNHVGFYERYMRGETLKTDWVLPTDYEYSPQRAAAFKQVK